MPLDENLYTRAYRPQAFDGSNGQLFPQPGTGKSPLRITAVLDATTLTLALSGEFDIATSGMLSRILSRPLGSFAEMVVDLRGLTFIDSAGMTEIIKLERELRRDGKSLTLIPASDPVSRTFSLVGLDEVLPFADLSADDGLRA